MSYSALPFDTPFNVAHLLKDVSFFINVIALTLSSIQYNMKLRESNRKLIERDKLIQLQYEKLKVHDNMQKEFINVAAHELRTPIQPILGLSEVIRSKLQEKNNKKDVDVEDKELNEFLDVIVRNTKRLQRLTEDILDVTKIESKSLKLNKEYLLLNDIISCILQDYSTQIKKRNNHQNYNGNLNNLEIVYEHKGVNNIIIQADKERIIQVICNLIDNAIKFSRPHKDKKTIVTINVEMDITNKKDSGKKEDQDDNSAVKVSIKDSGIGIDSEMIPKLFTKF